MKVKKQHLKELLEYMNDESVEEMAVALEEGNFAISFSFNDKENRSCKIIIYDSSLQKSMPRLIKDMELKTRLPKLHVVKEDE